MTARRAVPQRPSPPEELARWTAVDRYFGEELGDADEVLEAILRASEAAGLPPVQVSPAQGKFLKLLVTACGARRVLEVGTLGGYSATWMARGLPPGGRLITLEVEPAHAKVARANLERAGLADRVEVRLGDARRSLAELAEHGEGPFDLVFVDADKTGYPEYLDGAVRLSRPGTVIVADNVVRRGDVADAESSDPSVLGVRKMIEKLGADPRLEATVLQTVGAKGYDGFAVAVVR